MNAPIPVCPLMSAGNDFPIICLQEKCAWYIPNLKKCAVFSLGHSAMLDIKEKLDKKKK